MKKKNKWPNPTDVARKTLKDLGKVKDVKETMRKFDALQYEEAKPYKAKDIKVLREKKLKMSQAVFAKVCNIRLSTLQKWERGINRPTPPIFRLFQLLEQDALNLIKA